MSLIAVYRTLVQLSAHHPIATTTVEFELKLLNTGWLLLHGAVKIL
jgi:hypothetical protein